MTQSGAVPPIVIEIEVPVTPDVAWRAVTDPAEVSEWFAAVDPAGDPGASYGIDFGDGSAITGVIRTHDPGRRLAYSWTWADNEGGPTTLVTWDVEPADGGARIRLTHDGWSEAGADQDTRDDHADYWEGYLGGLQELLSAAS